MRLCAVVPVYQHVRTVGAVLDALLKHDIACIVVDDGNTAQDAQLLELVAAARAAEVLRREVNGGKGAAIQAGLARAGELGYTHVLQIDADGQHDTGDIGKLVALAEAHPEDMICGVPRYDASAPRGRRYGRYLTHVWVWINTLSFDIRDSMCGFRIYPLAATLALMQRCPLPERMDFDVEILVRLHWRGLEFRKLPTRVIYPAGGLSHFRLWDDNVRISGMHARLFVGMLLRLPVLVWRRGARLATDTGANKDKHPRGAHWASIGESTSVRGIALLLLVHRYLGRWPFRIAVFPVVFAHWALRPAVRRASLEYLRRMATRGPGGRAPALSLSVKHLMRFAETVLDKLLAAGGRLPLDRVRIEGRGQLVSALAGGRGAVIVTAHMGCVELCQQLAEQDETMRMNILVHTRHAEAFNRILRRLNPRTRARFMEVTDIDPGVAMSLAERVAAGECVVIAGDRVPVAGAAVAKAPFLGAAANFPVGPYVLASLFECPLFLMCCIREPEGYVIHFAQLAERVYLPRRDRSAALAGYAATYACALEQMLLRSPLDWFNFFDFWSQGHEHSSRT